MAKQNVVIAVIIIVIVILLALSGVVIWFIRKQLMQTGIQVEDIE